MILSLNTNFIHEMKHKLIVTKKLSPLPIGTSYLESHSSSNAFQVIKRIRKH